MTVGSKAQTTMATKQSAAEPSRFLVEVPNNFAIARWSRDADVGTIVRCILATLKYEPHSTDTTTLCRALETVCDVNRRALETVCDANRERPCRHKDVSGWLREISPVLEAATSALPPAEAHELCRRLHRLIGYLDGRAARLGIERN
jgi:hypothetical protein